MGENRMVTRFYPHLLTKWWIVIDYKTISNRNVAIIRKIVMKI